MLAGSGIAVRILILGCHTGDGHGSRHLLLGDDHRPRIVGGEAVVGCNVVHYIRK